jgi:hypothetical protein
MRISSLAVACATTPCRPRARVSTIRLHLVLGELVLIDHLDEVDAGVEQLLGLGARVVGAMMPQRTKLSYSSYGRCCRNGPLT